MNIPDFLPDWWLRKVTEDELDLVAEDDFNPDGVVLFGYDLYEKGLAHGVCLATTTIGIAVAAYFVARKARQIAKSNKTANEMKGETNESSRSNDVA